MQLARGVCNFLLANQRWIVLLNIFNCWDNCFGLLGCPQGGAWSGQQFSEPSGRPSSKKRSFKTDLQEAEVALSHPAWQASHALRIVNLLFTASHASSMLYMP